MNDQVRFAWVRKELLEATVELLTAEDAGANSEILNLLRQRQRVCWERYRGLL